jgi:hypothetical protein
MTNQHTDLIYRLRERARIRRQIPSRKSVEEGKPDRISDLLEEAAAVIETLTVTAAPLQRNPPPPPMSAEMYAALDRADYQQSMGI